MKIAGLLLAGVMGWSATAVMAHGFHVDAKELAAALSAAPALSDTYRDEVRKLRAERERLHRLGKHNESEAATDQAAKLLQKK